MTSTAAMASPDEPVHNQGKCRLAGLVLVSIVLIVMGLANLPYQYVETGGTWIGLLEVDDSGTYRELDELPRMAGWPLKYWVQYNCRGELQDRFWSTSRLVINLCSALILALVVYVYIQLRSWHTRAAGNQRLVHAIFDVGIALAILVVPAAVLGWEYRIAIQHQRLGKQLARGGSCYLSCWLPKPLVDHVPGGLVQTFARLRQVHLVGADSRLVQSVARLPTLAAMDCYRGTFDSMALKPLAENVHFSALHLSRRSLSDSDLDAIASLPWLTQLRLTKTNLDAELLRRLDRMRLRSVDLSDTPLVLSELGVPQWSSTLESLSLSRPKAGRTDSVEIDGWQRLKRITIRRLSRSENEALLRIRLANLPSLEVLGIDRIQRHHLVLENLPRLAHINDDVATLRELIGYDQDVPGLSWVSNLEVDGLASLTTIGCFARDLESISIRDAPSLRTLSLGSYLRTPLGFPVPQGADAARCQSWVNKIGRGDGPSTIDMTDLPLESCDLSSLVNNRRIRNLRFGGSGISFEQVKQLKGMKQLETLNISSCLLEQDQLTWLLQTFPNLTELSLDGSRLRRFDLSDTSRLRRIHTTPLHNVKDIRIVDRPSVTTYLQLTRPPERMEIRDARSLRGLSIDGPWPENSTVEGLRDLEWFGGGGKAVDDALLDVVLQCRQLDQLTLAYASITRQKLMGIGQLSDLTLLAVPGADVDDAVTAHWHSMKTLWEINLDDTSVSVQTLAWLSGIESLRRVSLNRVRFSPAAAEALAELRQLGELHLAGVSLEPIMLERLLRHGNLESLDLSGWKLDAGLIDALRAGDSLRHLRLRNVNIDAHLLERIVESNPLLCVDVGALPDGIDDRLATELQRRVSALRLGVSVGWRDQLRRRRLRSESESAVVETQAAERDKPAQIVSSQSFRLGGIVPQELSPSSDSKPTLE